MIVPAVCHLWSLGNRKSPRTLRLTGVSGDHLAFRLGLPLIPQLDGLRYANDLPINAIASQASTASTKCAAHLRIEASVSNLSQVCLLRYQIQIILIFE